MRSASVFLMRCVLGLILVLTACTAPTEPIGPSSRSPDTATFAALSPATSQPRNPTPTLLSTSPAEVPVCAARALAAVAGWQGAGGSMAGGVAVYNVGWARCRLRGAPDVTLVNARGETLPVRVVSHDRLSGSPDTTAGQVLAQGQSGWAFLVWGNWCGSRDATLTVLLTLPETNERLNAPLLGQDSEPRADYPRCDVPNGGSALSIDAFGPRP